MEKKKKSSDLHCVEETGKFFMGNSSASPKKRKKKDDEYYMSRKMGKNVIQKLLSLS